MGLILPGMALASPTPGSSPFSVLQATNALFFPWVLKNSNNLTPAPTAVGTVMPTTEATLVPTISLTGLPTTFPTVSSTMMPAMRKPSAATVEVMVGANGSTFSPAQVNVHVGDTVRWTWATANHTVTSGNPPGAADGKFCSPNETNCTSFTPSDTGFVYEHTFTQVGSFPYFCGLHFGMGMTGVVVVSP